MAVLQVLKDFGVARFDPAGEKFDPNMHDAQYEVPDPSKDAGTVAVVEKCGYMLHERVLRPAQVGVTRKP
jgi:molecular chaperone GrpE